MAAALMNPSAVYSSTHTAIAAIDAHFTAVEGDITTLQAAITTTNANVATNTANIAANTAAIAALNSAPPMILLQPKTPTVPPFSDEFEFVGAAPNYTGQFGLNGTLLTVTNLPGMAGYITTTGTAKDPFLCNHSGYYRVTPSLQIVATFITQYGGSYTQAWLQDTDTNSHTTIWNVSKWVTRQNNLLAYKEPDLYEWDIAGSGIVFLTTGHHYKFYIYDDNGDVANGYNDTSFDNSTPAATYRINGTVAIEFLGNAS